MNHPRRLILPLLTVGLAGTLADRVDVRAQEKKDAAKPAPAVVNIISDEKFEQYFFHPSGSAAAVRKQYECQLTLLVEEIDRACQMSDAQKGKLRVTGQGDIKRVFDEFEAAKRRFNALNNDLQQLNAVLIESRGTQTAIEAGVFNVNSLFVKSLRTTLSPEQFAQYEIVADERRAARQRAAAEVVVTVLQQAMPMRSEQRQKLLQLLLDEAKPVPGLGLCEVHWYIDQLAKLPDAKVRSLFTGTQWRVVNRQFEQYKNDIAGLRQQGVWPDDDADAAPKK